MEAKERRKLDKFEREMAFMTANATDFPANSPGGKIMPQFAAAIAQAKQFAAGQSGGAAGKALHIDNKGDDLDDLKELMRMLDNAADALGDELPGIENLFGLPRNRSEASLLAAARAQHSASEQYENRLIEYDLPGTFRADMLRLINDIDRANNAADTSGTGGAGSTGGLKATLAELGALSKKIDAINRNKHRANPAKMSAWTTASHLERDPQAAKKPDGETGK